MITLGLNVFHGDASACIFKNGKLITAVEEERFTRVKHAAGFPFNSIKYCLNTLNIKLDEVDNIAINRNPKKRIFKKLIYAFKNRLKFTNLKNRIYNFKKITTLEKEFEKHFQIDKQNLKDKIFNIDHHLSHAASSVYASGYSKTNYLTIDGFGDFLSTTIGYFDGTNFNNLKEVEFPHSLGVFYSAITQYLGFRNYGDEYKVMGLSSYGEPKYLDKMKKIVSFDDKKLFKLNLDFFLHDKDGVEMSWLVGEPKISTLYSEKLIDLFGPERKKEDQISQYHKDLASSAQKIYEEIFLKILKKLSHLNDSNNLCISGGCAMNSVANGKVIKETNYKNIYMNSAPGDSGGAIGSGLMVLKKNFKPEQESIDNPYLGTSYNNDQVKKILIEKNVDYQHFENFDEIIKIIAEKISKKKIIGFFQDKMEFGARALGNRSILADPRTMEIRDIINHKIKRRESFRPFAPAILSDQVHKWFDVNKEVPFMSEVYKVLDDKKKLIPSVVHVDNTGRVQTVNEKYNSKFYNLIKQFDLLTGVPIILNTSFNENEPIVNEPQHAIDCFLRTEMDTLVIQNFIISR